MADSRRRAQPAGTAPDLRHLSAVRAAANIPPLVYGAIAAIGTSFYLLLVTFLFALYYTGVSFVSSDGRESRSDQLLRYE